MDDALTALAGSAAALPGLFVVVLADAFLVIIPGEVAVTAIAALSASTGQPWLIAVIGVAAAAALSGDLACYAIGRRAGLERWRWMRHPRAVRAFSWAGRRLAQRSGAVLFTARFIPFARLAVNLTAGAVRMPMSRYLPLAAGAAALWALYQAVIGTAIARVLPGPPAVAVIVAVASALVLGAGVDLLVSRTERLGRWQAGRMDAATLASVGYNSAFLGVPVGLPRAAAGRPLTRLDYPRFTVLLDPDRRLAAATAVNIDGATLQDLPRTGEWELDPRVPAAEQTGPAVYADNDFDRGHLVRRRDPGWGTVAEARAATEATFVYTNAAPQASAFNQSKDLWVGLEDHVLEFADATDQRVSVLTGPVLEEDDPPYRGIRIPRRFWKIAAWTETDRGGSPTLAAAGFVLDQTALIDLTADALTRLGAFRTFQVPVLDIATLTALDVGPLAAADVMRIGPARQSAWIELSRPSDIRL